MTVQVGIAGATGYVGAELLRLCAGHPEFECRGRGRKELTGLGDRVDLPVAGCGLSGCGACRRGATGPEGRRHLLSRSSPRGVPTRSGGADGIGGIV